MNKGTQLHTNNTMAFSDDLAQAQIDEQQLAQILISKGCEMVTLNDSDDYATLKAYDISYNINGVEYKGELKTDRMSCVTGNVAVEYRCNDKPSGIASTEADAMFYKIDDNFYVIETDVLRDWIIRNMTNLRFTLGGDRQASELVLINLEDFTTIAKCITQ